MNCCLYAPAWDLSKLTFECSYWRASLTGVPNIEILNALTRQQDLLLNPVFSALVATPSQLETSTVEMPQ